VSRRPHRLVFRPRETGPRPLARAFRRRVTSVSNASEGLDFGPEWALQTSGYTGGQLLRGDRLETCKSTAAERDLTQRRPGAKNGHVELRPAAPARTSGQNLSAICRGVAMTALSAACSPNFQLVSLHFFTGSSVLKALPITGCPPICPRLSMLTNKNPTRTLGHMFIFTASQMESLDRELDRRGRFGE
jgi:hypothetical protein